MSRDTLIPVLQSDLDVMAAERDALIASLRDMVHYDDLPEPEQAPAMARARAILAKVRA